MEISGGYYEYIDVSSCQDIIHLYHLLWSATILNIVGLFLGIITAAILGGFKDMVRRCNFLWALNKTNQSHYFEKVITKPLLWSFLCECWGALGYSELVLWNPRGTNRWLRNEMTSRLVA